VNAISHAVQIIGFKQLQNLVVATSITHAFKSISYDSVSIEKIWMTNVEQTLIARILVEWKHFPELELMFVGGLLLNIDHLVMCEYIPEFVQ